jgi:hypothetical protein
MGEGTYAHRCTHGGAPRPHLIVQCWEIGWSVDVMFDWEVLVSSVCSAIALELCC